MSGNPRILTVDRNQRNLELLDQFLGKAGFETVPVSTMQGFEQILEQPDHIGLALVDISGFDRNIWTLCERLADIGVPLLVISPQKMTNIRQESMAHGAQEVLFKPLVIQELTSVIRSMLRTNFDE